MSESDEKFIFRSVADVISRMHLMGADEADDIILDLKRNQRKRNADVDKLMSFYFTADGCIDFESMRKWLSDHGDIDELFMVRVIEVAGRMMTDKAVSRHTSNAGVIGAKKRHEKTDALKNWAVKESKDLKMNDSKASRHLVKNIPAHLADASDDPYGLIYKALNAQSKAKKKAAKTG